VRKRLNVIEYLEIHEYSMDSSEKSRQVDGSSWNLQERTSMLRIPGGQTQGPSEEAMQISDIDWNSGSSSNTVSHGFVESNVIRHIVPEKLRGAILRGNREGNLWLNVPIVLFNIDSTWTIDFIWISLVLLCSIDYHDVVWSQTPKYAI
jgi:hypothetical protein